MTKKARKEKLRADIRSFHAKLRQVDPEQEATEEDLAESRRLIREQREVGLSEGEYLKAIHGRD